MAIPVVVHPRLAGHGQTLFAGLSKHVDLKLVSRLEFGLGGSGDAVRAEKVAIGLPARAGRITEPRFAALARPTRGQSPPETETPAALKDGRCFVPARAPGCFGL